MQIDMESLGYAIGTVITGVGGFGIWQRSNRVSNARTDESVAAANAGAIKHEGQADELKTLRDRLDAQDVHYEAQKKTNAVLQEEIISVKGTMLALSTHVSNVLLCEKCKHHNRHIIEAINTLVTDVLRRPKEKLDVSAP